MEKRPLIKTLEEIELYFAGCYMNAFDGSEAQKKFDRYMNAIDAAKNILIGHWEGNKECS